MLPLELGDPGLFGDDLQLMLGHVAFLFESTGGAIGVPRVEEWERLDDPEESLAISGVVARARAGFHRMSLKKHKKIVRGGKRSERGLRRSQ
jgi:hypothetical protein